MALGKKMKKSDHNHFSIVGKVGFMNFLFQVFKPNRVNFCYKLCIFFFNREYTNRVLQFL